MSIHDSLPCDEIPVYASNRYGEQIKIEAEGLESVETTLRKRPTGMRAVKFTEPVVTALQVVPKKNTEQIKEMFYSPFDIAIFRREHRTGYGRNSKYDRVHCENLVEQLDKIGTEAFAKGELRKALEAFNHSLRVRTETTVGLDALSTANTIHCIADVYSKQQKWHQALDAYRSALEALNNTDKRHDMKARRAMASLNRKISIIQGHLGLKAISRCGN